MIGLGAITIAEPKYAQHGAPVYAYIFMHESNLVVPGTQHKLGAAHALLQLQQPHWPAYDTSKRATMEIDAQCKVGDDPSSLERRLWEELEP